MIYIGLGLLFSLLCLAIISRIHFSKYKGRKKNMLGVLYCSMAETVYGVLKTQPFMERVKDRIFIVERLKRLVDSFFACAAVERRLRIELSRINSCHEDASL